MSARRSSICDTIRLKPAAPTAGKQWFKLKLICIAQKDFCVNTATSPWTFSADYGLEHRVVSIILCLHGWLFMPGGMQVRKAAMEAIPRVCRTASTLYELMAYYKVLSTRSDPSKSGMGNWGNSLRTAVAGWYLDRAPIDVAMQVCF